MSVNTVGRQLLLGTQLDACLTALFSTPKVILGTTYTLQQADNYRALYFTNGSAVTLTVPRNLGAGFTVLLIQYGAGAVTPTAGTGVSIHNRQSQTATAGQYAQCSLFAPVADNFIFGGDTA